jgi:hypothetical protein
MRRSIDGCVASKAGVTVALFNDPAWENPCGRERAARVSAHHQNFVVLPRDWAGASGCNDHRSGEANSCHLPFNDRDQLRELAAAQTLVKPPNSRPAIFESSGRIASPDSYVARLARRQTDDPRRFSRIVAARM